MAWLDDRAWCHPKLVDLSDKAFRVYVNGISYSSGMGLRGRLTLGQQKLIGADSKVRSQLVAAGLWHLSGNDAVDINGWDEHNGKRDERRKADRERKKQARASAGTSAGHSAGHSAGTSAGTARVEGSEGSEGSEREDQKPAFKLRKLDPLERLVDVLGDADDGTRGRLAALAIRYSLSEGDFEEAREAALSPTARSPAAVAYRLLEERGKAKAAA